MTLAIRRALSNRVLPQANSSFEAFLPMKNLAARTGIEPDLSTSRVCVISTQPFGTTPHLRGEMGISACLSNSCRNTQFECPNSSECFSTLRGPQRKCRESTGFGERIFNFFATSFRFSRRRMLNTRSGSGADIYPGGFAPLSDLQSQADHPR